MNTHTILALSVLLPLSAADFEHTLTDAPDPFPAFDQVGRKLRMPRGRMPETAPDGSLTVNGKPKFLIGMQYGHRTSHSIRNLPTGNYPRSLKWLYEKTLDYETAQRIGFDAVGDMPPNHWIDEYRNKWPYQRTPRDPEFFSRYARSGLPLFVDMTLMPSYQGGIAGHIPGKKPGKDAFTVPGPMNDHWMPWSLHDPEGRSLYRKMFRFSAEYYRNGKLKPFAYELFNEPDYNDYGNPARKAFAGAMRKRYGSIDRLNTAWHTNYSSFESAAAFRNENENPALGVEWKRFMQQSFAGIVREGVEIIRGIDPRPEALFCVQPNNFRTSNNDLFLTNRYLNAVCGFTGGGDLMHSRVLRALADGKPMFENETYVGKTRNSMRGAFLTNWLRGFNSSLLFQWSTSYWAWHNKSVRDPLAYITRTAPWCVLNPGNVPPEAITGIMDAKKEIVLLNDLFTPRDRGIKPEIALLYSNPVERLSRTRKDNRHLELENCFYALEYSWQNPEIIFEEQLAANRQARYRVLIAPGLFASYPETANRLEQFVRNGGTLVLYRDHLQQNEYGFPVDPGRFPWIVTEGETGQQAEPARWNSVNFEAAPLYRIRSAADYQTELTIRGIPAILTRKSGKGTIVFLNLKMSPDNTATVLNALLRRMEILPYCKVTDLDSGAVADRIEVVRALRGKTVAYALINHNPGTVAALLHTRERLLFSDPSGKAVTGPEIPVLLRPRSPLILVGDSQEALQARFGTLTILPPDKAKQEVLRQRPVPKPRETAFSPDAGRIRFLDLRPFVNRGFEDTAAGDGTGGWTDQGPKNDLRFTQFGRVECAGVPMDIIRWDYNDGRTCLVLGSKNSPGCPDEVRGIPVGTRAVALYFLQAAAWANHSLEEICRYIVRYRDGSTASIPIRDGIETGDWFWVRRDTETPSGDRDNPTPEDRLHAIRWSRQTPVLFEKFQRVPLDRRAVRGWINPDGKGFYLWRWRNPHPEKIIESLDIVSAGKAQIPILAAISAELPEPKQASRWHNAVPSWKFWRWGDLKLHREENGFELEFTEKTQAGAGTVIAFPSPVALTPELRKKHLTFQINGGRDPWGRRNSGGMKIRLRLRGTDSGGKHRLSRSITPVIAGEVIDSDPETWQNAAVPLDELPDDITALTGFEIQFYHSANPRTGILCRNFSLDYCPGN